VGLTDPTINEPQELKASNAVETVDMRRKSGRQAEIVRTANGETASIKFDFEHVARAWRALGKPVVCVPMAMDEDRVAVPTVQRTRSLKDKAGLICTDDTDAGEALARVLHKEDFLEMTSSASLTRVSSSRAPAVRELETMDDLFIIDQHAADEKYNFETLQQTTKIESQRLFR